MAREPLDQGLHRGGRRLDHQPQRAGVDDPHLVGARRERRLGREAGGRGPVGVEAVARDALRVDVGERQRGRVVGVDDRVEPDAVLGEQGLHPLAEAVAREPAEVGDRLLQAPDRARRVEGAATGVGGEHVGRSEEGTRSISASPATRITPATVGHAT